jgi:hypothetical protein
MWIGIHIGVVAYLLAIPRLRPGLSQAGSGPVRQQRRTALWPKCQG